MATKRLVLGALIGDYLGSVFEKRFQTPFGVALPPADARFTDDSVLTVAIADALQNKRDIGATLRQYWQRYPNRGYGSGFSGWAAGTLPVAPTPSFGNGSAMRVSAVAWLAASVPEVLELANQTAQPTHGHPRGVTGAQAVALLIFLGRAGWGKAAALAEVRARFALYTYDLEAQRQSNQFIIDATQTVEIAFGCLERASSFEEAIRWAVYVGGDTDTLASIAGAVAEVFYNPPLDYCRAVIRLAPAEWLPLLYFVPTPCKVVGC